MTTFTSEKLFTNYIGSSNAYFPLIGRKYTLTHSDQTGQLFLDIGNRYHFSAVDFKIRDEVLAEWKMDRNGLLTLFGKVYIDKGELSKKKALYRFNIFQKEMKLALKGIVTGDISFFSHYPYLLDAPIFIYFESNFPDYNGIYHYGTPRRYFDYSLSNAFSTISNA